MKEANDDGTYKVEKVFIQDYIKSPKEQIEKICVISKCTECKFGQQGLMRDCDNGRCYHPDSDLHELNWDYMLGIPDWCPLSDAKTQTVDFQSREAEIRRDERDKCVRIIDFISDIPSEMRVKIIERIIGGSNAKS